MGGNRLNRSNISERLDCEATAQDNVPSLFIMLPTLDEELALANVFERIPFEKLESMGYESKVVVVDGGSQDNTVNLAKELGCSVITQWGEGKGAGIRQAFKKFIEDDNDVLVMVNHIFLYNPGFIKLKEEVMVDSPIKSIRSVSGNMGPFRDEWSSLWDWGPHDLSMCLSLIEEKVNITNVFHKTDKSINQGRNYFVNLQFESGVEAELYFGNGFSKKKKIFSVLTETSEYVFNDLAQDKLTVKKNKGDKKNVHFENIMPLNNVIKEFKNSIINHNNYSSQFELAVDVVKLLAKIEKRLDEYAPKR